MYIPLEPLLILNNGGCAKYTWPFSINLLNGLLLKKVNNKALICEPSTSASVIIIILPYLKSFKSIS